MSIYLDCGIELITVRCLRCKEQYLWVAKGKVMILHDTREEKRVNVGCVCATGPEEVWEG